MFLKKLLSPIPFLQPLYGYAFSIHRMAFQKFSVLWFISILPLVFAAMAAPLNQKNVSYLGVFWESIGRSFLGTHQFIYAVSFITPIFYLLWEKYQHLRSYAEAGKRKIEDSKFLPRGFGWILFWSVLVFLVTAVAYANSTTIRNPGSLTLFQKLSQDSYVTIAVYLFSLCCWYFMILESLDHSTIDFATVVRKKEEEQSKAFSERISQRKEEQNG